MAYAYRAESAKETLDRLLGKLVVPEEDHERQLQAAEHEGRHGKAKRGDTEVDVESGVLDPISERDDSIMI